jgi:diguanylate cyclase (GGDEF)-like protein
MHSLPTRLGFFVLGATLCTSLVITAITLTSIDSFLREKIEESFPVILERTAFELDAFYQDRHEEAEAFARNSVLQGHIEALLSTRERPVSARTARTLIAKEFARLLEQTPQASSLFLLGPDQARLLWQGPEFELSAGILENISAQPVSRAGYFEGQFFQFASAQVVGDSGVTLHMVVATEQLAPILKHHGRGFGGSIAIIDSDRRYIASSEGTPAHKLYTLPLPSAGNAFAASESVDEDGKRRITSAMSIKHHAWSLVIEEAYDEAFARVVAATRRVLGINLAIVAIFALVAYRFAVRMIRPIDALSIAALRISRGEEDVEIPSTSSRDEVGLLTQAFTQMTNRIKANASEIQAAHRSVKVINEELRTRNDELHLANEVLAQLSITDGLTQLHNHRFFQDSIVKEAKRADRTGEPLVLILIDIDHFKMWNDRLGHAGGDEILRRISQVMSGLLRSSDLLARYGGEEFALVAPGTTLDGAEQLAEKMRGTIARTSFFIDSPSEQQPVTVSMGVALYSGDRDRFFSEADQALYRAKASGRDCVMVFDPDQA